MKVYAVHKNDEIIKGKLFALPEQAFNFFCEEFTKIYPNAKIEDVVDELKSQLKEEVPLYQYQVCHKGLIP